MKLAESWKFWLAQGGAAVAGVSVMIAADVAVANIAMVMGIASVFLVWHLKRYGPRIPPERSLFRRWRVSK